jgi:hypothetical protein
MVELNVVEALAITVFDRMEDERRATGALTALLGGERCVEGDSTLTAVFYPGSAGVLRRNSLS